MALRSRKIQCILCNGVVSLDDDKTRIKEHLDQDHAVIADVGKSWVMAVSLLDLERREKILATILDNINREPVVQAEDVEKQQTEGNGVDQNIGSGDKTKVILNIDISDDEADGDWDKNVDKLVTQENSFVELDESFGTNSDDDKFVEESTSANKQDIDMVKLVEAKELTIDNKGNRKSVSDSVIGKRIDLFQCRFCDFKSKTSFALKKHLKKHHSMSDDTQLKEESVEGQQIKEEKSEGKKILPEEVENTKKDKKNQLAGKVKNPRPSLGNLLPESETKGETMPKETISPNNGSKILEEIDRFSRSLKRKLSPNKVEEEKPDVKRRRSAFKRQDQDEALSVVLNVESKESKKYEDKEDGSKKYDENGTVATIDYPKYIDDCNKNGVEDQKGSTRKKRRPVKGVRTSTSENQTSPPQQMIVPADTVKDETLKEDFLNISQSVDLSGSSYFQFHQSMVKSINVRDIKYESLSRMKELPNNWFVYVSFFNGGKRKVTEYITPDRRMVRGKTAAVEFMKASNEYTEGEIKSVANHLCVKLNE